MYMTKTIHPLMSHYSSKKWGKGRGGSFDAGRLFKFLPIGGVLIRGGGALIRRFTVKLFVMFGQNYIC